MDDDFAPIADLLPDGAIPLGMLRFVSYLDADGEQHFFWRYTGEESLLTTIGHVTMLWHSYVADAQAMIKDSED